MLAPGGALPRSVFYLGGKQINPGENLFDF